MDETKIYEAPALHTILDHGNYFESLEILN